MLVNTYRVRSAAAASQYAAYSPVRRVRVGAPPTNVELDLPGSVDDVRAYGNRIDQAWMDFWKNDVRPWSKKTLEMEEDVSKGDATIGEVLGEDKAAVEERRRQIKFYESLQDERNRFLYYKEEIDKANPKLGLLGPRIGVSPSEAWQQLQIFETNLTRARQAFQAETGQSLKSPPPKELELPGGVEQGLKKDVAAAGKKLAEAIPWSTIAIVGAVGLVGAALLKK